MPLTASPRYLDAAALRDWPLPSPESSSDKEERGHVLVVAGSREIAGAALLAATAALRAGAGKLTIATAQSISAGMALALPEARVIGLPETQAGGLLSEGTAILEEGALKCAAVLIGPGLLDSTGSCEFVLDLLARLKSRQTPVILDALAMDAVLTGARFTQPVLLTPHAGEMAHLSQQSKLEVQADALAAAQALAQRSQATVVLKGATTYIALPQGPCWRHDAAVPGLATSGSGDVLAGIMAGLAARGAALEQAAAWAVVLHAEAGKRLAQRIGPLGFMAREIPPEIPQMMRSI